MKLRHGILIWVLCLLFSKQAAGGNDLAVIVHLNNPVKQMERFQISDMFLGRRRAFPDGAPVTVLEMDRNDPVRELFFSRLNGMSIKRLNAYWARLQFSGNVQPPPELKGSTAVLNAVRMNTSAIGYVPADLVDGTVSVVLMLKE